MHNQKMKNFILELIFPSSCYKCKKSGAYLCISCYDSLDIFPHSICPHCDIRLPEGKLSDKCYNVLKLDRLFTCSNFRDETLNKLIKDLKYKKSYTLSKPLAQFTYWWLKKEGYIEEIKKNIDVIIPIPIHLKKHKERGFNQVEKIAQELSKLANMPVAVDLLIKIRKTRSQVETENKKERERNLKNAFSVSGSSTSKMVILLVDDVITTGSTMRECAKTLRRAGAKEVWGLAITKD